MYKVGNDLYRKKCVFFRALLWMYVASSWDQRGSPESDDDVGFLGWCDVQSTQVSVLLTGFCWWWYKDEKMEWSFSQCSFTNMCMSKSMYKILV